MMKMTSTNSISCMGNFKPALFLFLLGACVFSDTAAQAPTSSISFENGSLEEIKTKATAENKLIFLDAYASWCGPCKKMSKQVFTNDKVAEYFNANFINAKIDMEAGEGRDIAKLYAVSVYPSLLFINGEGKVLHRATGAYEPEALIELAKYAQDPDKASSGSQEIHEEASNNFTPTFPNKFEFAFTLSQYQKDFGAGLSIRSPYFFRGAIAIRVGANIQWFENFNGTETIFTSYQNIRLGTRGRSFTVTDHISVYGEGGVLMILPNKAFSSENLVMGGYGVFGFDFYVSQQFAYYIELGGVGTGATADKSPGKPIYSNGFLTNVGCKLAF